MSMWGFWWLEGRAYLLLRERSALPKGSIPRQLCAHWENGSGIA